MTGFGEESPTNNNVHKAILIPQDRRGIMEVPFKPFKDFLKLYIPRTNSVEV